MQGEMRFLGSLSGRDVGKSFIFPILAKLASLVEHFSTALESSFSKIMVSLSFTAILI